jgi:invasion protein IalB
MVAENGYEPENSPDSNTHYMWQLLCPLQMLHFENCYIKQVIHDTENCTSYNNMKNKLN